MEDEQTSTTDNRSADHASLRDAIRGLPQDNQLGIAIGIRNLHDADGGVSEESVVGTNPSNVLIRGLGDGNAGDAPSNIATDNRQNPSEASIFTDPTTIDRYNDASEMGSFRSFPPRSVQILEQQPLMDATIDEDGTLHDPVSTVTGQYNDASEPGTTMSAPPSTRSRQWCHLAILSLIFAIFVAVAPIVLVLCTRSPGATETGDRPREVLKCASMLSNENITEESNPILWNVTRFFIEGGGRLIETPGCHTPDSLFSVIYALIVIRESLNVTIPSWRPIEYNITTIDDVCGWKRLSCDRVDGLNGHHITRLTFNHADLVGTLPPEIQWLRTLEFLDVNSNPALFGTIPSELGALTSVNYLFLHKTSLNGTVPEELGRLTSLQQLILYDTSITGTLPKELCDLPDLKRKTDIPCSRFEFLEIAD